MPARKEYLGLGTSVKGYERWHDRIAGKWLSVHQLLAIADGADPYKVFSGGGYHVHHENEIPWDNRSENLELLTRTEHFTHHADENPTHLEEYQQVDGIIDSSQCESLRQDYSENTIPELSESYNISTTCVYDHLNANCHHHNDPVTKGFDGPRDGPWRDGDVFKELYLENGLTYTELSELWGCSLATISNWAAKHGISR